MELNFFGIGALINALGFVWFVIGAALILFIATRATKIISGRIRENEPWHWFAFRNMVFLVLTIGIFFVAPNSATSPKLSLNPDVENRQSLDSLEMREPVERDLYMEGFRPLMEEGNDSNR